MGESVPHSHPAPPILGCHQPSGVFSLAAGSSPWGQARGDFLGLVRKSTTGWRGGKSCHFSFAQAVPACLLAQSAISRVLCIFWVQVLCDLQIFLLVRRLFFHSLNNVVHRAKVFNFDRSQFVIFFFYGHTFAVPVKNSLPNTRSKRFSPVFS